MTSKKKLTEKVHRLRELENQISILETEAENIKDELKSIMMKEGVDELTGDDWKVTWKKVLSSRFDQSNFKASHPDLFESFKVISESRRFNVK